MYDKVDEAEKIKRKIQHGEASTHTFTDALPPHRDLEQD